ICDAVTAVADGNRVLTKVFPVRYLPGAPNVPNDVPDPQTLSSVDSEGQTLPFIEVSRAFALTQNQVDNEQVLKVCENQAKLAAQVVTQVAEQIIAQGATFVVPQGVKVQRLNSARGGLLGEAPVTIPVDPFDPTTPGVYLGNT